MTNKTTHYFHEACSWADDKYGLMQASRARYQVAFLISMSLALLLSIAMICLMPLKRVQTVAVHHYENGITTVETESQDVSPINRAQIESDIVRYIQHRESYDISSYRTQFELVTLLSNDNVAKEFELLQANHNPDAPINHLGTKVTRSVHIYSISFIDNDALNQKERKLKQTHANLAEVVFAIKDHEKTSLHESEAQFSALISWRYVSPPSSIEERWKNFDGFEVTRYTKSQRNV